MRYLLIPVVIAVLLLGIWVTGGVITNDFTVAMLLSAAWMGLAGLIALGIALRRPRLRVPVLGAYLVTALAVGAYLGSQTFLDDTVEEDVAMAAAPAPARGSDQGGRQSPPPAERQNSLLRRGSFESVAHPSMGVASAIELAEGGRVLTLTDFETDPGPDLRVYLVAGGARDEGQVSDFIDIGGLKGNKGNQQYKLPRDADLSKYNTAVIWCRAFSVQFARAPLE